MKINRNFSNITVLQVFFVLFIGLLSCVEDPKEDILFNQGEDKYENIMQYIDANPNFSSFSEIVHAGNLTDVLSSYNSNGGNSYTLFLPTNEAVTKFIEQSDRFATFDDLLQDEVYSAEIVKYHLVNERIPSNDFPNGALADKTISNYFLTIVFKEENGVISYAVNDESKVLTTDIKKNNGVIHTIDKMLTPVVFTSYEWVQESSSFTIYAELLQKCGLADSLNAFELDELGRAVYNEYTLFAESDALYAANNIFSFDDLVNSIDPSGAANQDFTNTTNLVNKYARYHILEQSVFIDEFISSVYNTYGDFPISVDLDSIIKINKNPKRVFDVMVNNKDTVKIDYLQVDLNNSNIVTRSGAIHQLDHLLYPYLPARKDVSIDFYLEPILKTYENTEGSFRILDEDLKFISFIGTRGLIHTKLSASEGGNNYIEVYGDVDFIYKTPKILAGRYNFRVLLKRGISTYASIQGYVDDKKVGVVIDATQGGFNGVVNFGTYTLGTVEFSEFTTHTVKLSTVIPGYMLIDRIIFEPI